MHLTCQTSQKKSWIVATLDRSTLTQGKHIESSCSTDYYKTHPMLQQLRVGLERYDLIKVMQKKPQECHDLFVIGYDDKLTPITFIPPGPEMSPIGSIKQVKESKIMEFFQDFLLELE
ncbi:hypothetical protein cypCar_00032548, partial [Cyprinus carpio]